MTFATGGGAKANGTIGKALNIAHLNGFNKYVPGGNSCFMNEDTIDKDEMNGIMHEVILERMEAVDSL